MRPGLILCSFTAFLALGAMVFPEAASAGQVEDAEHVRLTEEMRRLAKRNAWKGVESAYVELEKLGAKGGTRLTFEDHYLGAQASRALGSVNDTYDRLQKALQVGGEKEAVKEALEWLNDLKANYGSVVLTNKLKKPAELSPAQMPFAPDKRNVIVAAQAELASGAAYKGLLPIGEYTFGSLTFVVNANQPEAAYVLQEVKEPREKEPLKLSSTRLRVDVGAVYLGSNSGSYEGSLGSISGLGPRAGIGLQLGFSKKLSAFAEVGYQGTFGPSPMNDPEMEQVFAANLDEWTEAYPGDRMSGGYAWFAGAWRMKALELSLGPSFSFSNAANYGLQQTDWGIELPAKETAANVISGGATGGLSYTVLKGGSYQGAVALYGGAQSDTQRLYGWGQAGLTALIGRK